jgi:hypothetical protein
MSLTDAIREGSRDGMQGFESELWKLQQACSPRTADGKNFFEIGFLRPTAHPPFSTQGASATHPSPGSHCHPQTSRVEFPFGLDAGFVHQSAVAANFE